MGSLILIYLFTLSPFKGALLSLIVPGLGEKIAGNDKEFYMFITGEIGLISTYFTGSLIKKEIRNNYKIFAYKNAEAFTGTDEEKYWTAVENYYDYESYYEYLLREARSNYPYEDPSVWENYARNQAVLYTWSWKDTSSWDFFLLQRERERLVESRLKLLKGFIITYHLFSSIYTFVHLKLKQKAEFEIKGNYDIMKGKANLKIVFRF